MLAAVNAFNEMEVNSRFLLAVIQLFSGSRTNQSGTKAIASGHTSYSHSTETRATLMYSRNSRLAFASPSVDKTPHPSSAENRAKHHPAHSRHRHVAACRIHSAAVHIPCHSRTVCYPVEASNHPL